MIVTRIPVSVVAIAIILTLLVAAFGQSRPKDYYNRADAFLKQGLVIEAYDQLKLAELLEPASKKYQNRLIEVGKLASPKMVIKSKVYLPSNVAESLRWLERAVDADESNGEAKQLLSQLRQNIGDAKSRLQIGKEALNGGNLPAAKSALSESAIYSGFLPEFKELENEVQVGELANHAVALWLIDDSDGALNQLEQAETRAPNSIYVSSVSKKLRGEISAFYVRLDKGLPSDTLENCLAKLRVANYSGKADPSNTEASALRIEASQRLLDIVLKINSDLSVVDKKIAGRIALQRLIWLEKWMPGKDSQLGIEESKLESAIYPAVSVRISAAIPTDCPEVLGREQLAQNAMEGLKGFAKENNEVFDFDLRIKDVVCSVTDVPRQNTQKINSTYIVGYNQVVNPEYTIVQQQLQSAQAALTRAQNANTIEPNVGNAITVGFAQGTVNKIERRLRQIPPYLDEPIIQQYQYEKFESYRASRIDATIQLIGKIGTKQFTDETKVVFASEKRNTGSSGVLPSDKTGAINLEAFLPSQQSIINDAVNGWKGELHRRTKEILGEYFASRAMDKSEADFDRLAYLLFLADISQESKYAATVNDVTAKAADSLVRGIPTLSALVSTLNLPLSDTAQISDTEIPGSSRPELVISKAMEGVVSVETESGIGSGFFINSGCLVITNAHVVSGAETIVVRNAAKRIYPASVIAIDDSRDLALLRSNVTTCSSMSLADSSSLRIGQDVYAIGSPLGLSGTVTKGIISNLRLTQNGLQYVQLDASLNPGNSGGPLINVSGQVVGVNSFKVKGFEGLNFAIGSNEIKKAFSVFMR